MGKVKSTKQLQNSSLRVNLGLLDNLMNMAGELVLSRNQLLQALAVSDEKALHLTSQRIDLVTSELQEGIMKTRMQPLSNIFNKFPRVVHDLAKTLGKKADLSVQGEEVELDKTIIEAIAAPFTQLIRNAIEYGIEMSEARKSVGKSKTGRIQIKAFHEAGQVNIEITDDGQGMDADKIATIALANGLIPSRQLESISPADRLQLIFLPEFCTNQLTTEIPGCGPGLDVIRCSLEKFGGVISVNSEHGKGTTFRIELPLTLAIIPSQIVTIGREQYAIPQVNLDELLRVPANQVQDRIEKVGDADVIRLRGQLLPLLDAAKVLGVQRTYIHPEDGQSYPDRRKNIADRRSKRTGAQNTSQQDQTAVDPATVDRRKDKDRRFHTASSLNIAVVSAGLIKYGLIVDQMHDSEEIVVKPLGRHLSECQGYAGATIMGDGKVALILDLLNLAKRGQLNLSDDASTSQTNAEHIQHDGGNSQDASRWLCFRIAEDEHFAIEMSQVQRIERIEKKRIEHIGGKIVVQNMGRTLPLVCLDQVATIKPMEDRKRVDIVTMRLAGREFGLMVAPPVDALELSIEIDEATLKQPGIRGSAVINERTALIVDAQAVVQQLYPEWIHHEDAA